MRPWKIVLLVVSVNLCFVLALVALAWTTGALALPLGDRPAAPEAYLRHVPYEMNYQGLLLDDAGDPISGTHDLLFTIYYQSLMPLPPHWVAVFSETHTVDLDQGLFNVVLGEINPLDPEIFDGFNVAGGDLEVGVAVDGGAELSPRMPLLTSPFAFRSEFSNNMPFSEWNSGWRDVPGGGWFTMTHALGGDPDHYIVTLECDDDQTIGIYECGGFSGHAWWANLTDSNITVWYTAGTDHVRVRIWVTK